MRLPCRDAALGLCLAALLAVPLRAQQPGGAVADLLWDIEQVEQKLMSLARAFPADKWDWRPGEGVRSVGEVYLHVAADNWFIPAAMGMAAPEATGITAGNYETVQAYESRKLSQDAILAEFEHSFTHLKHAMSRTTPDQLGEAVSVFGQSFTRGQFWVLATTHLHEHLGQLIAYARSNGIVPPWSRGQ